MRLKLSLVLQGVLVLFIATSVFVGFSQYATESALDPARAKTAFQEWLSDHSGKKSDPVSHQSSGGDFRTVNQSLLEEAPAYVKAIMTPEDTHFPKLQCLQPTNGRYDYLRPTAPPSSSSGLKYFFALDMYQCAHVLPRLFGSIVETMRFLGPENCELSVVEGRSTDGTYEILKLLSEQMQAIGVAYTLQTSSEDPHAPGGDRITSLAKLRNLALSPLINRPERYASDGSVIFLNDVAICMEDILELLHQRLHQSADMTCAMDWTFVGKDPTFYDVWIARGMNGDSFFEIGADGNWNSAWNVFWNNPDAQSRLRSGKPFQVYSCWNGAAAFTMRPLLEHKVNFRESYIGACRQGEPLVFCKDLWYHGYGKIATVPSVNIEYSDEAAGRIKALKKYVSDWVRDEGEDGTEKIEWQTSPPEKIKCIENYANQIWVPWDQQLAEHDTMS